MRGKALSRASVAKASAAAQGLYSWVNAVRNYYFVYRDSAPIRDKLIRADL